MKKLLFIVVVLAFVAAFAPQTPHQTTPAAQAQEGIEWTCPPEFAGQTLNVYNWSLYIGEETIPTFEELCDVTVNYDVYDTTEIVISKLREGNPGYDVVFMSDFMITMMAEEGYLEELDLERIPNWVNIADAFKNPTYDPENRYSVPYQWGTSGIMYRTDAVEEEITSWQQLFDFDGAVAWLDEATTMIAVGLIMNDYEPNPNDEESIEVARDYLIENGGNVRTITAVDIITLLETGEIDMAVGYSGEAYQLLANCECDDFTYVIPEEGSNIYVDAMSIPVGGKNPDLAYVFIDYILDPHVGAAISNYIAYATPNQAALDMGLIDETYLENPVIYLPEEVIERLYFLEDRPELEQAILDAWDEITLSVGE
jgi:spermidine/putrescine transport system substrate-binding protein